MTLRDKCSRQTRLQSGRTVTKPQQFDFLCVRLDSDHRLSQSTLLSRPPTYSSAPTIQFARCAILPNYLVKRDTGIPLLTHDKYQNLPPQ